MNHFPVTNSNLSALHIAIWLSEKYNLSNKTNCNIIKAGINDTYLVTDGSNKYIFRIYSLNWRTEVEISEEIKLLNELKDNNISVSFPIKDKQEQFIQKLAAPEGERFGVLFSFAEGEKRHIVSAETHFAIGQLMARLHAITENKRLDRVDYTEKIILEDSLKKLSEFLPSDTEEMAFMKRLQTNLVREFANAEVDKIRKGIVHLDIWFDNLNISAGNKVTIFDFDFCGNGWLSMDVAYYILQLHNIEKYEQKEYEPKVDSFLRGYESITKLSTEEKRLIPMLGLSMYFFYLGIQCERYDNWSNTFLNENYLKRFINGLVKRYAEIYQLGDK